MSIKYSTEIECLVDLTFWGGAADRMNDATDEQRQAVYDRLEELQPAGGYPSLTAVNDFVWFGCDDIFFPDEYNQD